MLRPVPHQITEGFGSMTPFREEHGLPPHRGVDFASPLGTTVNAPLKGVATIGWDDGVGNFVIVRGAYVNGRDRLWYQAHLYHLSEILVASGQEVIAGVDIGLVGNTGEFTSGPHLHMGLQRLMTGQWQWIDPEEYI